MTQHDPMDIDHKVLSQMYVFMRGADRIGRILVDDIGEPIHQVDPEQEFEPDPTPHR